MPFDEDDKDKSVWFLDHDYLENMYGMFKKVNGKISLLVYLPSILPCSYSFILVMLLLSYLINKLCYLYSS